MFLLEIFYALPSTFIPLFVAMDAPAGLAIFISLTEKMPKVKREKIVRGSVLTALLVSLVFLGLGEFVFKILGITENDFKIAGGLILLIFAIQDLVTNSERRRPAVEAGIVPIGVPLIAGPAVLTTIIVLVDHYGVAPTAVSLFLNLAIIWMLFNKAEVIVKIFGKVGVSVLSKIMLLFLSAIAIMMIRIGIEGSLK
jgi:multiple antibiotic resistance protein